VTDANFSEVVTTSPVDGASDISIQHVFEWEADSRYTAYDIQIASDANFATIIDSGTSFGNTYLASNLSNATSYFWRVRPKNSCGEGVFGSAIGFNTIGQSCISRLGSDLPVPIASNGAPTITSTVEFFDDLILTDLSVNIELEHTYLGDLVITLTAPSGRVVTLFSRSCGNVQNINATFSDAGQVFDCSGTPAISGMVQPLISFSSLIGESIAGKWVLTVNDLETNDGGALIDFTMDVCAEGQFSADADGDGVFDANDLCPNTAPGELVDATGCPVYRLANNNFELKATSASCRNVNDGVLEISTMESLDYTVTVSGNGVNMTDSFTTEYVQNNLGAGTYTFCFDATDGSIDYEQVCFEVLITEPEPLSVSAKSNLEAKTLVLDLEGSDIYTISLNGLSIQTTKSQYTLDLKPGNNAVEVVGSLACQGKYEEQFFVASGTIVYPNPASNVVRLFIADGGQVTMNLYSIEGRLVHTEKQNLSGSETEIDVSTLSAGTYFLKVESASQKGTYKIIKE